MKNSATNRGMTLEYMINATIELYRTKHLALIQKIPTPISPGRLNPKTKKLEGAYFLKKSTVDYIGVVQEVPICFDAKETKVNNFPLSNIKEHQLNFMKEWEEQGGVSFLLIYWALYDEVHYVPYREIINLIDECNNKNKKRISYESFDKDYIINIKNKITFPFLSKLEMDLDRR